MQPLFEAWKSFAADLKAATHILLLSDYDGTLTPIVSRPEEAVLSAEARKKLKSLAEKRSFSVGIVSGRPLSEIKAMVGISGIYYAGNHGFEIEGPGLRFVSPVATAAQTQIKKLVSQLSKRLSSIKGIIVEDKGLSLSVHYRLVKEDEVASAAAIFQQITGPLVQAEKNRVTSGKKVWEVRPPIDWHKGKAVETIREQIQAARRLEELPTIYLGDDTTDEDAFRAIHRPYGWSIFVGGENQSSAAEYCLNSTKDVETFLSRLLTLRQK